MATGNLLILAWAPVDRKPKWISWHFIEILLDNSSEHNKRRYCLMERWLDLGHNKYAGNHINPCSPLSCMNWLPSPPLTDRHIAFKVVYVTLTIVSGRRLSLPSYLVSNTVITLTFQLNCLSLDSKLTYNFQLFNNKNFELVLIILRMRLAVSLSYLWKVCWISERKEEHFSQQNKCCVE